MAHLRRQGTLQKLFKVWHIGSCRNLGFTRGAVNLSDSDKSANVCGVNIVIIIDHNWWF